MNDSNVDITEYQTNGETDTDALLPESNGPRANGPEDQYGNCVNSEGGLPEEINIQSSSSTTKSLFCGLHCIYSSCNAAAVINCRGWLKREITMLLKLALPITLSIFFQFSMLLISLFFIGHIPNSDSALYYGSAGLASSFVNVTSTPIGHGLGTAADTLCSQAFGHKNYKRVGIILQRGIFILGLFILPICALWINARSLLLLLHQPPCVARYACGLSMCMSPIRHLTGPVELFESQLTYLTSYKGLPMFFNVSHETWEGLGTRL